MGNKHDNHVETPEADSQLEPEYVTLTLDNDEEVKCRILTVLEVDSREYIALQPLDKNGKDAEGGEWFYRFTRDTSGEEMHKLGNIDDDEEFEKVLYKFDEWLDFMEFGEMDFFEADTEE